MTLEKRWRVGPGDIKAVSMECSNCHARLTLLPTDPYRPGGACVACGHLWTPSPDDPRYRLREIIGAIQAMQKPGSGFEVFLELEEPKN